MRHIISATGLVSGEQLAMCGHVFRSYQSAVTEGHQVGNYLQQYPTLSAYHAYGVDCESCIVAFSKSGLTS
jgi:hypothetical protein